MSQPATHKADSAETLIKQLREYEVIKLLGRGGMGIVYLVRHALTKRVEVLKVLRPSLASRTRLKERFLREVQLAAKLDHPNVVKTFTAIQSGELLALVMEFVDGQDLETWVQESGPLTIQAAASVIRQAAMGLQHAADHGLTHRDIKPSNILITRSTGSLIAKLSDFGLSKLHGEPSNNSLTMEGRFLGTPDYMAPEQALDAANATIAADIYGLGCSLYYALVGEAPYRGVNALAVLNMHIQAPVPNASAIRDEIPIALSSIISLMMQKDPRARYTSPAEVANALLPFARNNAFVAQVPCAPTAPEVIPTELLASDIGQQFDTPGSVGYRPTASLRKSPKSKRRAPIWPLLVQIAMPLVLVLAVVYYIRPLQLNQNSSADGTLIVKQLPAGTFIDIDDTINVAADTIDKQQREIRLSPGIHKLKLLNSHSIVMERDIEIKPNSTFELSLSYKDNERDRQPRPRPLAPKAPEGNSLRFEPEVKEQVLVETPIREGVTGIATLSMPA